MQVINTPHLLKIEDMEVCLDNLSIRYIGYIPNVSTFKSDMSSSVHTTVRVLGALKKEMNFRLELSIRPILSTDTRLNTIANFTVKKDTEIYIPRTALLLTEFLYEALADDIKENRVIDKNGSYLELGGFFYSENDFKDIISS